MGGKTGVTRLVSRSKGISIHLPHGGQDLGDSAQIPHHGISIHLPHGGQDAAAPMSFSASPDFNPLAPWGARRYAKVAGMSAKISIHLPHGGQDYIVGIVGDLPLISIHLPHGGQDPIPI